MAIEVPPCPVPGAGRLQPEPARLATGAPRIPQLDGLRGFACLLVLICHYVHLQVDATPGSPAAYALRLLSFTWSGVDLFFVLSGFLLGGILLDHRGAANLLPVFYLRRTCRIFPLYFAWLASFALGLAFLGGSARFAWLFDQPFPLWSYASYLQNFFMAERNHFGPSWLGITWSLAIEEQFYLLLPALILLTPAKRLPGLLVGLILSAPVCRALVLTCFPQHGLATYFLLPCRWDALFLGVLGAWAVRRPGWDRRLPAIRRYAYVLLGILAAGVFILMKWSPTIASPVLAVGGYTWIATFYLVVLVLALYAPAAAGIFRNRLLAFLGSISYGTYLTHQGVSGLLHGLFREANPKIDGLGSLAITAAALGLTLLLAWVSYTYFESPILRWAHRWKYQKRADHARQHEEGRDPLRLRPAEV